ncbi:hypothetical protein MTO96_045700 [Rhipicephalus appendiculatus]
MAEGRWATLLARQAVTSAQDQEELEAKVQTKRSRKRPNMGEKSNAGGVDPSRANEEASGGTDDCKVNATEVSTIGDTEDESCQTEGMLLVHATDNHDLDADAENERQATAPKVSETTRASKPAVAVGAKTQATEIVAAAVVADATEDSPEGRKSRPREGRYA